MGFSENWGQAGDDWEPPDGLYNVKIVFGGDAWTTDDGRDFAKLRLRVTSGTHEGHEFIHFMNFNNVVGAKRARTAMLMYGIDVDAIDSERFDLVGEAITRLAGLRAEVQVKRNDPFINVDVVRVITGESDLGSDQVEMFQTAGAKGREAIKNDDDDLPY